MAEISPEKPTRGKLPPTSAFPPPETANFFYFNFLGPDVQMLVGYADLGAIHEARATAEAEAIVPIEPTHRFFLSAIAFGQLREKIHEIGKLYDQVNKPPGGSARG